ncbi:MAG TPA: glycosyltransferase family 4 protein, partial [Chthoniobacter sp.]|nr:glycosyltransferase family 4 protein [Chthoniobacter sp.]
ANDIFCDTAFPVSNEALVRDARFVVTETDYARRWMEERYPWARGKVFRVFNGVAIDGFPAKEPASGVPRIISVGRYVEKKGFGDLIEACRQLRTRGIDFTCGIVGGGPLEAQLQAQIAEARLEQHVQLLGPRSQGEVRRLLAASQVFVLACVLEKDGGSDNLPTVIMEAMLARTPVISTALAGVPEMITPGEDGQLVPPRNPVALAEAMEKLLANPTAAARLGQQGRSTAEAKFAVDKTTSLLKHLLVGREGVPVPDKARQFDPSLPKPRLFRQLLQILDK